LLCKQGYYIGLWKAIDTFRSSTNSTIRLLFSSYWPIGYYIMNDQLSPKPVKKRSLFDKPKWAQAPAEGGKKEEQSTDAVDLFSRSTDLHENFLREEERIRREKRVERERLAKENEVVKEDIKRETSGKRKRGAGRLGTRRSVSVQSENSEGTR
jgi:hypothetical protein